MLKKDLLKSLNDQMARIEHLFYTEISSETTSTLNRKPSSKSWSAIECIEHLNKIGTFYVTEFERSIDFLEPDRLNESSKSTFLGRIMLSLMSLKKNNTIYKMKTFKQFKPNDINKNVSIDEFIDQIQRINIILQNIKNLHFTDAKINSALGSVIKFNLSDGLQFVIAHIERHLVQAVNAKRS